MFNVSETAPGFTASLKDGNPLARTIWVIGYQFQPDLLWWYVTNDADTGWLKVDKTEGFGDGFFSLSVNIYDKSVVLGVQTATLLVSSQGQIIPMLVTLTVYTE